MAIYHESNVREERVPVFRDEGVDYKTRYGCKVLQTLVRDSVVTPISSVLRRVRLVRDGRAVADVIQAFSHVSQLTPGSGVLQPRRDVTHGRDDVRDTPSDVTHSQGNVTVKKGDETQRIRNFTEAKISRDNVTVAPDDVTQDNVTAAHGDVSDDGITDTQDGVIDQQDGTQDEGAELSSKTSPDSHITSAVKRQHCTLSKLDAINIIKTYEDGNFEIVDENDVSNGRDLNAVQYHLFKYTTSGFLKMIYTINRCTRAVTVNSTKTDLGTPCRSRAKGVGGSYYNGPIFFGRKPFCLMTSFTADRKKCILSNKYVEAADIRNIENWDTIKSAKPLTFDCEKMYFDRTNGAVSPLMDGFFYVTQGQRMLEFWYNYTKLRNPPVKVGVHYGVALANSYMKEDLLLFGDGDFKDTSYATAPDMVAHELAHMIMQKDSDINQRNSTGPIAGIREAFADIFAKTVEFYIFGMFEWTLASWLHEDGQPIRSLELPPMLTVDDLVHSDSEHYSGGVFARVFYRMAKMFGIRATTECLLYANTFYWYGVNDTYESISCTILQAAYFVGLNMYEINNYNKIVKIDITKACNMENFKISDLLVGTNVSIIVSSRRRPFFRIFSPDMSALRVKTTPKSVRIKVTRDRQGKLALISVGLGKLTLIKSLWYDQGNVYIHFYTGLLSETRAQITTEFA
ncbi:uncharacterized protein LOC131938452 [Physella acuta]|uniref:uncharacterized protein LOC131938452 n=1 Tax=Physella acuta TaxID=109671 RepID=UPI0027DDA20E|nr:uncharacterized protein LOC131938452 [Physella acuta]